MQHRLFVVVLALGAVLLAQGSAAGLAPHEPGILLGPFELHVGAGLENIYETNVFREAAAAVGDLAIVARPSLVLVLDRERIDIHSELVYRDTRYLGLEDPISELQNDRTWLWQGNWRQELGAGLGIDLHGEFEKTSDPILGELSLDDSIADGRARVPRRRGVGGLELAQNLGTGLIRTTLAYEFIRDAYEDATFVPFDRDTHELLGEFELQIFPTLLLFTRLGYTHFIRPVDATAGLAASGDVVQLVAGMTGTFSPLYRLDLRLGVQSNIYESVRNTVRPVANAQFTYLPTARLRLRLGLSYESLAGVISDELLVLRGMMELEQDLGRAWRLSAGATVWQTRYLPEVQSLGRTDVNRRFGTRLAYAPPGFSLLELAARYDYLFRTSNLGVFDFQSHRAALELRLTY